MDKNKFQYFSGVLNQRLDELSNHAEIVLSELVSQSFQVIEHFDRVSMDMDQSLKLRIKSRERLLIKKIRLALERIEDDSYGICDSCGEDISIKRLEARPVTTKCIHCKIEEEKLELLIQ